MMLTGGTHRGCNYWRADWIRNGKKQFVRLAEAVLTRNLCNDHLQSNRTFDGLVPRRQLIAERTGL
jgi:hypothetical protein